MGGISVQAKFSPQGLGRGENEQTGESPGRCERDLLEAGDWCASRCSEGVSGLFLRSSEMTHADRA